MLRERGGENVDLRQSPAEAGEEAGFVLGLQLVFPNPQHAPAEGAERAGDEAVAGSVAGNFFAPELGILLGLGGVERAAVPEAAVDEDGEAVRAGKHRRVLLSLTDRFVTPRWRA